MIHTYAEEKNAYEIKTEDNDLFDNVEEKLKEELNDSITKTQS